MDPAFNFLLDPDTQAGELFGHGMVGPDGYPVFIDGLVEEAQHVFWHGF